jgi:Tfp pilus assembly protein PilO
MSDEQPADRRNSKWKARAIEALHDPTQLRIIIVATVLLAGYCAIYMPLDDRIAASTKKLEREVKVTELAAKVEHVQKEYAALAHRVPEQSDAKEWVQYMLEGIRRLPVKMGRFDCRDPKPFGKLKVIVFQIDLEGTFFDLDKFLRWLESNKRLLRVDDFALSPTSGGRLTMRLTILGLSG